MRKRTDRSGGCYKQAVSLKRLSHTKIMATLFFGKIEIVDNEFKNTGVLLYGLQITDWL